MINLDVLQEQRYCHTSGQHMRVHLPTAQVQSQGKPYKPLKKFQPLHALYVMPVI
jgi:hypothetical protein